MILFAWILSHMREHAQCTNLSCEISCVYDTIGLYDRGGKFVILEKFNFFRSGTDLVVIVLVEATSLQIGSG